MVWAYNLTVLSKVGLEKASNSVNVYIVEIDSLPCSDLSKLPSEKLGPHTVRTNKKSK